MRPVAIPFVLFPMASKQTDPPRKGRGARTISTKIMVTVPPGRLGIHFVDNTVVGKGTIITKVSDDSPMVGKLLQGDQIIEINGTDVHQMSTAGEVLIIFVVLIFIANHQ